MAVHESHLGASEYPPLPDILILLGVAQGWRSLKSSPGWHSGTAEVEQCRSKYCLGGILRLWAPLPSTTGSNQLHRGPRLHPHKPTRGQQTRKQLGLWMFSGQALCPGCWLYWNPESQPLPTLNSGHRTPCPVYLLLEWPPSVDGRTLPRGSQKLWIQVPDFATYQGHSIISKETL